MTYKFSVLGIWGLKLKRHVLKASLAKDLTIRGCWENEVKIKSAQAIDLGGGLGFIKFQYFERQTIRNRWRQVSKERKQMS